MRIRAVKLLSVAAILTLAFIVYSNSFDNSFHFDDQGYIVDNPAIRTTNFISIFNSWTHPARAVAIYTFALNYKFHQLDVFGYHAVNFAIHVTTALLLWWLMNLLMQTPKLKHSAIVKHRNGICLLTALLFVVHPVQTQAVTYISQRFASLATMFYLASICFYLKGRLSNSTSTWDVIYFTLCAISALLGMFTKQIVITLPFTILLVEYCFMSSRKNKKENNNKFNWVYGIVILLFVLVIPALYSFNVTGMLSMQTSSASHTGDHLTPANYFLSQLTR